MLEPFSLKLIYSTMATKNDNSVWTITTKDCFLLKDSSVLQTTLKRNTTKAAVSKPSPVMHLCFLWFVASRWKTVTKGRKKNGGLFLNPLNLGCLAIPFQYLLTDSIKLLIRESDCVCRAVCIRTSKNEMRCILFYGIQSLSLHSIRYVCNCFTAAEWQLLWPKVFVH